MSSASKHIFNRTLCEDLVACQDSCTAHSAPHPDELLFVHTSSLFSIYSFVTDSILLITGEHLVPSVL